MMMIEAKGEAVTFFMEAEVSSKCVRNTATRSDKVQRTLLNFLDSASRLASKPDFKMTSVEKCKKILGDKES
jgi:hypothetical protein